MTPGIYRLLLRLYPVVFYQEFADEMAEIYDLAHTDAARQGTLPVFYLREVVGLLRGILQEHRRAHRGKRTGKSSPALRETARARRIVRLTSLGVALFFLIVSLPDGTTRLEQVGDAIMIGMQIPLLIGLLLAWQRERTGGVITLVSAMILCGIVCGGFLSLTFIPVWAAVIGSVTMFLPYMLFGLFFMWLANRTKRLQQSGRPYRRITGRDLQID